MARSSFERYRNKPLAERQLIHRYLQIVIYRTLAKLRIVTRKRYRRDWRIGVLDGSCEFLRPNQIMETVNVVVTAYYMVVQKPTSL